MSRFWFICWILVDFAWMGGPLWAGQKRVAILGDSITYGWAARVESALRATPDFKDAEIVNFGLPSETLSGDPQSAGNSRGPATGSSGSRS